MTGVETALCVALIGLIGIGTGSVTTGIITGRSKVSKDVCVSSMGAIVKLADERHKDLKSILKRIEGKIDKRNGSN